MARNQQQLSYDPVSRVTIKEHIYDRMRDLILNGELEPGRTVTVQSLSEAFGVSAMPVREALHRLVAERALTVVAGRSVGIPQLTVERLLDLSRVRIEIEGTATVWATRGLTPQDLDQMAQLIDEMDLAKLEGNHGRYVPANRDFHFTIYRAAGSDAIISLIESLWLQIGPYFNLLNASGNWTSANVEHRRLRDALERRDSAAARKALEFDISAATSVLKNVLSRRQGAV